MTSFGAPESREPSLVQHGNAVGAQEGLVGIVRGEQHADARSREVLDMLEHAHLVAEVEVGGRLVHDQICASCASARAISVSCRSPPEMRV